MALAACMFAIADLETIKKTALAAGFGRPRVRIDLASVMIVLLLSLLFAGAISSALAPHPLRDATQAAFEGGL